MPKKHRARVLLRHVLFLHFLVFLHAGLAVPVVGVNAFATARKYVDKVIVVKCVLIGTFPLIIIFRLL